MENSMTKEEELQEHMALIEQYKEQLNSLDVQFSYLQNAIMDQTKAKMTLEHLGKTDMGVDLLLPIGGGAFIDATAKKTTKVLFDVGDGIIIEKISDDVIDTIDKRIKNLQQTEEKISNMVQKLQKEAAEVTDKAQKLMSGMSLEK
jgi:prefoldin alpha subunit